MASAPVTSAALMMAGMFRYDSTLRAGPMHTDWSAKRTCSELRSGSENTATVLIPSSRHAQMTRSAISPRLAIRIFLNMRLCRLDGEQPLAVLHRLSVLDVDAHDFSFVLRSDLVHELHGLDDTEHLVLLDPVADLDERRGTRLGRSIEGPDNRRLDHRQLHRVVGFDRRRRGCSGGRW